jgi:F-type H+-transporting ATPase subunit delta
MKTVQVTTAVALTTDLRKQVVLLAAEKLGEKTVELEEIVDPKVIGGMKLNLGGRTYDATVAKKLELLRQV